MLFLTLNKGFVSANIFGSVTYYWKYCLFISIRFCVNNMRVSTSKYMIRKKKKDNGRREFILVEKRNYASNKIVL